MQKQKINVFWFRRDLRLEDNAGLYYALKKKHPVLTVFVFDKTILNKLPNKYDRRVDFIYKVILGLNTTLSNYNSSLKIYYDTPINAFKDLLNNYRIDCVYTNHDYEVYAADRDRQIESLLKQNGVEFKTYKDQCIFEKDEILKDDGKPYTVFTPYSRKWKNKLNEFYFKSYPCKNYFDSFLKTTVFKVPTLTEMGFEKTSISIEKPSIKPSLLKNYKTQRDYPAISGTSRLSMHLRFGTISIRTLVKHALTYSEPWLNELIWRDFYMMILWHYPHVEKQAFKKIYDRIEWLNNETDFKKWCLGITGFPMVDAGMRELNATGFMHNRVRMITASFLTKHLLIDWRWGEAYFAEKLNDFDLSANNGGWQWAAGSGCDAAPYFRIFNPTEQQKKFDPDFIYIKKWIPEFGTKNYPEPIVEHSHARERALAFYKRFLISG